MGLADGVNFSLYGGGVQRRGNQPRHTKIRNGRGGATGSHLTFPHELGLPAPKSTQSPNSSQAEE